MIERRGKDIMREHKFMALAKSQQGEEQMNEWEPPKIKHWYRVEGQVIFCVRYTVTQQKSIEVDMEGVKPQDYAAYITHMFLGESKEPYRTVAQIAGIPMPEPVRLHFSSTVKIEEMSTEGALSTLKEEQGE